MKITVRVTAAMKCGIYRHPIPKYGIEDCYDDAGSIDRGKLMRSMDVKGVTLENGDTEAVALIANEFLMALERIVKHQNEKAGEDRNASEKDVRLFEKGIGMCVDKIDDDKAVCFVRFIVRWVNGHVVFTVCRDNPNGLKLAALNYNWQFCIDAVRMLLYMRRGFVKNTGLTIEIVEGKDCEGLVKEADDVNALSEEKAVKSEGPID